MGARVLRSGWLIDTKSSKESKRCIELVGSRIELMMFTSAYAIVARIRSLYTKKCRTVIEATLLTFDSMRGI
jgi:hypothetical protein